ncbi:MAG TPA: cupin domain-containing protein, partial [Terriglobales bacterium]|nr:cupin domain-containing protein [Terriglobales bacterium]
ATGAQAISLRVMEFAPGLSPEIRNDDCDEILYVSNVPDAVPEGAEYSSQGQAHGATPLDAQLNKPHPEGVPDQNGMPTLLINGASHNIGRNTGIYVRPCQTFAIDNPGPESIIVISCQCPDPDRAPQFVSSPTPASDPIPTSASLIIRLADRPAQPTADRWYRVLVDHEIGSDRVTQFVGSIPPGRAPDHFHNYEEVLFILKGKGRMWAGETNTPISAGSCIYLPKGQIHCVENTGEDELRLLGVFYPAGSPSVRYDV